MKRCHIFNTKSIAILGGILFISLLSNCNKDSININILDTEENATADPDFITFLRHYIAYIEDQ